VCSRLLLLVYHTPAPFETNQEKEENIPCKGPEAQARVCLHKERPVSLPSSSVLICCCQLLCARKCLKRAHLRSSAAAAASATVATAAAAAARGSGHQKRATPAPARRASHARLARLWTGGTCRVSDHEIYISESTITGHLSTPTKSRRIPSIGAHGFCWIQRARKKSKDRLSPFGNCRAGGGRRV